MSAVLTTVMRSRLCGIPYPASWLLLTHFLAAHCNRLKGLSMSLAV